MGELMVEKKKMPRDPDVDAVRLLASFFVVMIHIPREISTASVVYHVLSRFSVPVFCVVSGYYLLDRSISFRWIARQVLRIFTTMVLWSGIYFCFGLYTGKETFQGLGKLIGYLLTQPVHLWYFYTLAGLYLFTPCLSVFAKSASRKEYLYVLAVTFFFGSFIVLGLRWNGFFLLSQIMGKMQLDPTLGFVFCYLFGGFVKRFGVSEKADRLVCAVALVTAAAPIALYVIVGEKAAEIIELSYSFFSCNALLSGIAVFLSVKKLWGRKKKHCDVVSRLLNTAGIAVPGVYFAHILIVNLADVPLRQAMSGVSAWLSIPVRTAAVYLVTLAGAAIFVRIPIIRKLFWVK